MNSKRRVKANSVNYYDHQSPQTNARGLLNLRPVKSAIGDAHHRCTK